MCLEQRIAATGMIVPDDYEANDSRATAREIATVPTADATIKGMLGCGTIKWS
jgi:hypothetical protein